MFIQQHAKIQRRLIAYHLASNFLDAGGVVHLLKAKLPTVTSFSLCTSSDIKITTLLGYKE